MRWLLLIVASIGPAFPEIIETGCPAPDQVRVPSQALRDSDFVELQRGGCLGSCPVYSLRIQANGEVTWKGDYWVNTEGAASETVSSRRAKALIEEFRTPAIWSLCHCYSQMVTERPAYQTTISIGGTRKHVLDFANSAPEFLRRLDLQIDSLANSHLWRHTEPWAETFEAGMLEECYLPKPGVTPLMCTGYQKGATLGQILRKGENVNAADSSGWTPLMYAAYGGKDEVFDKLLDAGADPKARSWLGQTALMAVTCGFTATIHKVKRLVDAGADINAIDADGRSALMFAVRQSWSSDELGWLISQGARSGFKDVSGKSAFDYLETAYEDNKAESAAHDRVLRMLQAAK